MPAMPGLEWVYIVNTDELFVHEDDVRLGVRPYTPVLTDEDLQTDTVEDINLEQELNE